MRTTSGHLTLWGIIVMKTLENAISIDGQIEVNLRCRISNYFSIKYGVLGYKNADNFVNGLYYEDFVNDMEKEINRNSKAPFVKNFKTNYENGDIPFYALVELFSFGTLSKFYKNMKNEDKKEIAKTKRKRK